MLAKWGVQMEATSGLPAAAPASTAAPGTADLGTILDCAVCWEAYDSDGHCPRQLICGHSLCDACIRELPWATLRGVELPFLITCPWCMCWSPRVIWEGALKYPSKNFSLMWLVESYRPQTSPNPPVRRLRHASFPNLQALEVPSDSDHQRRLLLLPRGTRGVERESVLTRVVRDAWFLAVATRSACSWLARKFSLLVVAGILCIMLMLQVGLLPIGVFIVISTMMALIFVGFAVMTMTLLFVLPTAIVLEIGGNVLRRLVT
ncbi:RING/U-box superfamily protein [Klebsormidium nitens]|uniref:RING/U-box superfamily protein n=1 Tax=Klebsormidium nitens TaxID=105231 RepID=A0A1Y1IGK0_KLENI|nr:RING/U-box superfamily protein [Klebsormidium nitens]|eukprot:GAQ88181.1 RING/U-box superfamily protein [Klebsormidium nitens]